MVFLDNRCLTQTHCGCLCAVWYLTSLCQQAWTLPHGCCFSSERVQADSLQKRNASRQTSWTEQWGQICLRECNFFKTNDDCRGILGKLGWATAQKESSTFLVKREDISWFLVVLPTTCHSLKIILVLKGDNGKEKSRKVSAWKNIPLSVKWRVSAVVLLWLWQ